MVGPGHWGDTPPTFIYRIKDGRNHISTTDDTQAFSCMDTHADLTETGVIDIIPVWKEEHARKAAASWEALP